MLGAKKVFYVISFLIVNVCCAQKKQSGAIETKTMIKNRTNNNGYYTVDSLYRNRFIQGQVLELDSKKPLKDAIVKLGCYEMRTDGNGWFSFDLENKNNNSVYLTVISIGFLSIESSPFTYSSKGVKLLFYLEKDKRPMLNCEGLIIR